MNSLVRHVSSSISMAPLTATLITIVLASTAAIVTPPLAAREVATVKPSLPTGTEPPLVAVPISRT
jgi:hypothetical protein